MSYPPQPYPPQQPGYPPAQPGYPPAPPQQPYYPPPQYPSQQYPPQPPKPAAKGTIDDFYTQPAGGSGKSLASWFDVPGKSITGVVARKITNADVQQQTDITTRQPVFFADGRPKLTMVVPLIVAQTPDFPEGRAAWYIRGDVRNELARAMQEAGAPEGPPEAGAQITITLTGTRQIRNLNPAKVFAVQYVRPQGAAPAQFPATAPQAANGQVPQQPAAQPQWPQPGAPLSAPPVPAPAGENPYQAQPSYPMQGPPPGGWLQPQQYPGAPDNAPDMYPVQPQAPAPAPAPQQAGPAPMDADHQALLARLSGQQAPPQQPQG